MPPKHFGAPKYGQEHHGGLVGGAFMSACCTIAS
jgi:hypothetical protein